MSVVRGGKGLREWQADIITVLESSRKNMARNGQLKVKKIFRHIVIVMNSGKTKYQRGLKGKKMV